MANWVADKTGRIQVRAYAGIDKRTKKKRNLYASLPAGATQAEIDEACAALDAKAKLVKEQGFGMDLDSMVHRYFDVCVASGYAPSTIQAYRSDYRCHVQPYLGAVSVAHLRPWNLSEMFVELADSGKVDGEGLATSTMAKLYSWLNACFKWMVGEGNIPTNPMEGVKRIYPGTEEAEPIGEYDLTKIYSWLKEPSQTWDEQSLKTIIRFDLGTGFRRGEISALQIADLRTATNEVSVRRSATESGGFHFKKPKSRTSIRRVGINEGISDELTKYIADQRTMLEEQGLTQTSKSPLFCHADGTAWRPSELTMGFGQLRKNLGLDEAVHFHSMRHTHASQLLADGCDIRTLQERLGHSSVNTTLRIYGHVLPGRDKAAAEAWARHEERLGYGL